jgi:hypothetical protein
LFLSEPVCPAVQYEEESLDEEPGDSVEFDTFSCDKAYDWLEADDPALFSDDFSEPEDDFV